MFRPWLQVEWFRKITNYQKKLVYFQNFSDEVMDGVMLFSFIFVIHLLSLSLSVFIGLSYFSCGFLPLALSVCLSCNSNKHAPRLNAFLALSQSLSVRSFAHQMIFARANNSVAHAYI